MVRDEFHNNGQDSSPINSSRLSGKTIYYVRDDFLFNTKRKYINELGQIKNESACVVMGTVTFIEPELDSYYLECAKCAKNKVRKSQVAYLGDIDVIDEDGATLIYHLTKMTSSANAQIGEIHQKLIGKRFLFKIDISEYNFTTGWNVYTIMRLCDDDNIIQQMIKDDATKVVEADVDIKTLKNDESDGGCLDKKDVVSGNRDWFLPSDADPDNPSSSMVKRETDVVATDCSTNSKLVKLKIESPLWEIHYQMLFWRWCSLSVDVCHFGCYFVKLDEKCIYCNLAKLQTEFLYLSFVKDENP
ncbi:hypothetical protein Tco_1009515 [Tanacetum coccineum]